MISQDETDLPAEDRAILQRLRKALSPDAAFTPREGMSRIIGSMCSAPDSLAARAFQETLEKNSGDPGLFPGTVRLEEEILSFLGRMTGNPSAAGTLTSGGTEANILALWAAREGAPAGADQIILPETAHFSFDKAAALLGLRLVRIPADSSGRCPPAAVRRALTPQTAGLVAVAGTTGLGAVDPVGELSEIALQENLYLHVDGAFGGFVLPFLPGMDSSLRPPPDTLPPGLLPDPALYSSPDAWEPGYFAFAHPGVSSLTLDPHKMGRAPIPAGVLLFRHPGLAERTARTVPYRAGGTTRQQTLTGTRPGAAVCAVWTALERYGFPGYRENVAASLAKTAEALRLTASIEGLEPVIPPPMNVLGLRSPRRSAAELAGEMRKRDWQVSLFSDFIRIVLMPHVTMDMIHAFFTDIREVLNP